MSTTSELLNKLNVLRAANGKPQLKSWKESRAKLEQRLRLYEQNTPYPNGEPDIPPYKAPQPVDHTVIASLPLSHNPDAIEPVAVPLITADDMKRVSERRAKPVREIMSDIKAGTVTLADIARELRLNPKVLRAKMRRLSVPQHYVIGKHTYKLEHKADIIDIIKRDHRRK